ncbi:MAG: alpha/beta fold hydrolase [Anaerolineales bacterium]|jgi:hypothetical protein
MKSINKKTIAIGIVLIIIISIGILGYRADQPYPTQPKQAWIDSVSGPDVIRESTFIKNDGLMLEADLILPVGGADKKPAVVFVGGSGDGLYQGYSNGFLETFIQGIFLPRNFAVFYFNKRGMGQSEGSWLNNSIQGRAEDAYAAVEFLKSHPAIDSQNIGVIGHSQGGWVVNLVASQHEDIAFFISLAGPTTTVIGNMEDNYRGAYICEGFKGEELEKKIANNFHLTRFGGALGKFIPFGEIGFVANIIDYDPYEALHNVTVPGLFVYGENDNIVFAEHNMMALNESFNGSVPEHLKVSVISKATHGFTISDTPCVTYEERQKLPQSDELVATLENWLADQGY